MFVALRTKVDWDVCWEKMCRNCIRNAVREIDVLSEVMRHALWSGRDENQIVTAGMDVTLRSYCNGSCDCPTGKCCRLKVDVAVHTTESGRSDYSFHWVSDCDEAVTEFQSAERISDAIFSTSVRT